MRTLHQDHDFARLINRIALLRIDAVMRLTGLRSRQQIYALVHAGELPPPVKIGARASAWRTPDVIKFIETRTSDPLKWPAQPAARKSQNQESHR